MKNENETIVEAGNEPRVYEISYILVPTLSEEAAAEKITSLKATIAAQGGSFISEEESYLKDLAYEMLAVIKNVNNRFDTGYFGWVKFDLDPAAISKVEKTLKLDEDVIRFLTVKADRNINIYTKKITERLERDEANIDTTTEAAPVVDNVASTKDEVVV